MSGSISRRSWLVASAGLTAGAGRAQQQKDLTAVGISAPPAPKSAEIVSNERIWDRAPHNAFTDLLRFRERFYCVFREGKTHVSEDGAIQVLTSPDGSRWESAARLDYPVADLRDPKLCVTPDSRLMLTAAAAMHPPADFTHHTMVWFSYEGRDWTPAERIGEPNVWLWRPVWHAGKCYAMGYSVTPTRFLRVYLSVDGKRFQVLNPNAFQQDYPSEATLLFLPGDDALCLLRREGGSNTALLGRSRPPYRGWTWQDSRARIGGPDMIRLDDGRLVAALRLYDGRVRTSVCWVNPETAALEEFLRLPSSGDTSYPGLVMHDGLLHVSFYSSHEGRSSIYLAKVKLPPPA
jgi:hypothetical protein